MGDVRRGRTHRTSRWAVMAAAMVLAVTGCIPGLDPGQQEDDGGDTPTASEEGDGEQAPQLAELGESAAQDLPNDPAEDPAYADFYAQRVEWGECDETVEGSGALECGSVEVPLAWDQPDGERIEIAMVRLPASGQSQGSLLVNPGGPGGSGVDTVALSGEFLFSEQVRGAYDLVGFDPRGVSRSAGIECLDDEQTDEYRAETYDPLTPEGLERATDTAATVAEACQSNSGDVLPYLDTYSAARDMDVLRAAVESENLDYLGFSYGTYLGSTYAELYPQRVGRFVLDAALDPSITLDELSAGQAEGFENATAAFVENCLAQGSDQCPLTGTSEEGVEQIRAFFDSIDAEPLETSNPERPLTGALARSGLLTVLYSDETWPMGITALDQAMSGDGTALLNFADIAANRQPDGTYRGNSTYAITAVNCLDHPGVADQEWQVAEAERLAQEFPTFGRMLGLGGAMCEQWPVPPLREPAPVSASGSDLIVVVGTTGDPATPYEWSVSLDEQLENSTLITYDGNGHTAYGRSGGCVEEAVDAYLLEGTPPEEGLTCP